MLYVFVPSTALALQLCNGLTITDILASSLVLGLCLPLAAALGTAVSHWYLAKRERRLVDDVIALTGADLKEGGLKAAKGDCQVGNKYGNARTDMCRYLKRCVIVKC
jgi:hypothetical protein